MNTDTRTDEELNRIIAEWAGVWAPVCDRIGGCMKILFGPKVACKCDDMEPTCPNYCRDLNAVHEAEKNLDGRNSRRFDGHLLVLLDFDRPIQFFNDNGSATDEFAQMCKAIRGAEARQRAEALVRVIEGSKQ